MFITGLTIQRIKSYLIAIYDYKSRKEDYINSIEDLILAIITFVSKWVVDNLPDTLKYQSYIQRIEAKRNVCCNSR